MLTIDSGSPLIRANSSASSGSLPMPSCSRLRLAMLAQCLDQNVGQRYLALAGLGFRRLKPNAERLGFLQSRNNAKDLAIEVNVAPAQRQRLTQPQAGEQRHRRHGAVAPALQLRY
jgi:hypothetical protein